MTCDAIYDPVIFWGTCTSGGPFFPHTIAESKPQKATLVSASAGRETGDDGWKGIWQVDFSECVWECALQLKERRRKYHIHAFVYPCIKQLCSGLCTVVDSENTGDLSISETPPTRVQIINRTLQETHLRATHRACVSEWGGFGHLLGCNPQQVLHTARLGESWELRKSSMNCGLLYKC